MTLALNTRTDKLTMVGPPARYDIVMRYAAAHGAFTWARRNVRVTQAKSRRAQDRRCHLCGL